MAARRDPAFSAMANSWEQELYLSALHYRIRSCQILVTGKQQKQKGDKTRTRSGSVLGLRCWAPAGGLTASWPRGAGVREGRRPGPRRSRYQQPAV
jgi:hypothetical protein